MIAIGVYVCVVFLYLVYDYIYQRNTAQRILLLLCSAVFSASAFAVAWDILWIQYLCGIQTILELLSLVSTVDPAAFPFHVVSLARTLNYTGIVACTAEHNTVGSVLLLIAWLLSILDILLHLVKREWQHLLPFTQQEANN